MSKICERRQAQGLPVYRIEVRGRLGPERSAWFEGMTISSGEDGAGQPIARLEGSLADQAALHGILNNLYTLGLVLLRVQRIDRDTRA